MKKFSVLFSLVAFYSASAGAVGLNAVQDGNNSRADGVSSIALGNTANASETSSIALGTTSTSSGAFSIAVGSGSKSTTNHTIAVGERATASGVADIAIGKAAGENTVSTGRNIMIGESALKDATAANNVVAIGTGAGGGGGGTHTVAIGTLANNYSIKSPITTNNNVALGYKAYASGGSAVAAGHGAMAEGSQGVALGFTANASHGYATALGRKATASNANAVAIGNTATASSINGIAIGTLAENSGRNGIAMGNESNVRGLEAVGLGHKTVANEVGAVALGSESETSKVVSTSSSVIGDVTYGNFAGSQAHSTVSVGKQDKFRTITNVAAGQVNANSTDAVNGSQLYSVGEQVSRNLKSIENQQETVNRHTAQLNRNSENIVKLAEKSNELGQHIKKNREAIVTVHQGLTAEKALNAAQEEKIVQLTTTVNSYDTTLGKHAAQLNLNSENIGKLATKSNELGQHIQKNREALVIVHKGLEVERAKNVEQDKKILVVNERVNVHSDEIGDNKAAIAKNSKAIENNSNNILANSRKIDDINQMLNTNVFPHVGNFENKFEEVEKRLETRFNNKMNDMNKDLRAGIAGATALSFIQMPRDAGKNVISASLGGYKGESALAVGYSMVTDSNKWGFKAGASVNTRKDFNWGASVGYQW